MRGAAFRSGLRGAKMFFLHEGSRIFLWDQRLASLGGGERSRKSKAKGKVQKAKGKKQGRGHLF